MKGEDYYCSRPEFMIYYQSETGTGICGSSVISIDPVRQSISGSDPGTSMRRPI